MVRTRKVFPLSIFSVFCSLILNAQSGYWQQSVDYTMEVAMDVETYQYNGTQLLKYTNNSPDTLQSVYYHMYFNAFQPGSEMDARLQNVADPDSRMFKAGQSRISVLKEYEMGYLRATSLQQDGEGVTYSLEGTVLEVALSLLAYHEQAG